MKANGTEQRPSTPCVNDGNGQQIVGRDALTLPELPPEILLEIFLSPCLSPVLNPAPITTTTLHALLLCSRLTHACAKQQLNEVLVLPRHVREFRKFYDTERQRGWPALGITKGIFCALDDVSRLTHTSAGWETAFLRTLHLLGPSVTHLSLWHSESRVLLRDAGQVQRRGGKPAVTSSGPVWMWGQGEDDLSEAIGEGSDEDENSAAVGETEDEKLADSLNSVRIDAAAEVAAMRERARQQMPNWLKRELAAKPVHEVAKNHHAHLAPFGDPSIDQADVLQEHFATALKARRRVRGCRPTCLSIILSLPLFENQAPDLFASLAVFSRCQELDVYLPVPSHAPKLLFLLSHLRGSPLRRLKITSTHATLCIALPPFTTQQQKFMEQRRRRQLANARANSYAAYSRDDMDTNMQARDPEINIATALRDMLAHEDLRDCLYWELAGKHADAEAARNLEKMLTRVAIQSGHDKRGPQTDSASSSSSSFPEPRNGGYNGSKLPPSDPNGRHLRTPPSPLVDRDGIELVRVKIIQGKQVGHGRLRERKDDFITRVMGISHGLWEVCGVWEAQ